MADPRPRLAREVAALRFLAGGSDWPFDIPSVLAFDEDAGVGLYSWLDGSGAGPATDRDLEQLSLAIGAFTQVSRRAAAHTLTEAAEATLTAQELITQIRRREAALLAVAAGEPPLADLLRYDFAEALESGSRALERRYAAAGLSLTEDLPPGAAVLSPSDFGLHNCLRRPDGRLAFLDFEYFGWDDPVRLVTDVICHPAMALDADQRSRFLAVSAPVFQADPTFAVRLEAMAPLIALRWAMIVLNEFIPAHWRRRVEAGLSEPWADAKARQIHKARTLIALGRSFQTTRWT